MKRITSTSIPKIDSSQFYWSRWRAGSIQSLGVPCRKESLTSTLGRVILSKHAVGWCYSETLPCRPKANQFGIMCFDFDKNEHFWFHLRRDEFEDVFMKE